MTATRNQLPAEADQFARLDGIIRRGRKTFIQVASAFVEMKVSKAYKAKFGTFEEYCASRGYSKTHAYRMIEGASVINGLENVPLGDEIKTVSQATALAKIPVEDRPAVVSAAAAKAEAMQVPITAKIIKESAAEVCPPAPTPAQRNDKKLIEAMGGKLPALPGCTPEQFEEAIIKAESAISPDAVLKLFVPVLERRMMAMWDRAKLKESRSAYV